MQNLKFAVIGCGFWSNFQVSGWYELDGVELVAVCDADLTKANQFAEKFKVKSVYQTAEELFENEDLDFVDIISGVNSHLDLIRMAASKGIPVICQKPMALDLKTANELVSFCQDKKVSFFVHENFRWQKPIRKVKEILDQGVIGEVFKAKISLCTGFPVFENQPYLAKLEKLIIADLGIHLLDISRFLLGEMRNICCNIRTVNKDIKGEDVANILMETENGASCFIEMSFSSVLENDHFPEPLILIEGSKGSISLGANFTVNTTIKKDPLSAKLETKSEHVEVENYSWADPDYAVAHASIVETNRNILSALQGREKCETSGEDNLKTLKLVYAAYESAKEASVVSLN